MTLRELERGLHAATDSEAWVALLARYFDGHDLYYGHGTDNAADEAYWLVRAVQAWAPEAWSTPPDPRHAARVVELARERATRRIPLAYLLGEAWFARLRFTVNEHVLVPRSPLAELIEAGFAPWCELAPGDRVLDIGTGSGCLAIATAYHAPGVRVDATEISPRALEIAAANVRALELEDRVSLHAADLYPPARTAYRVILANPPYVPSARLDELPPEYGHEPRLALDGGRCGLDAVAEILKRAPAYLAPGGVLIVEVGEAQPAFAAAFPELPVTWLEFERGGDGVLLLTRDELTGHSAS